MKTAKELGIEQWEHDRLIDVKSHLENDTLKDSSILFDIGYASTDLEEFLIDDGRYENNKWIPAIRFVGGKEFSSEKPPECGTVCCIGGSMFALEYGTKNGNILEFNEDAAVDYVTAYANSQHPLRPLFYPRTEDDVQVWNNITKDRAARAIGNFLETGFPKWEVIFAEDNLEFGDVPYIDTEED